MADEAGAQDEFGLIAKLFAPLSKGCPGALGLIDDAAFLAAQPGFDTVATMDTMVAGVHFLDDDPADLIARKLIRVNLSDLAAKGARPAYVMLSAAFPSKVSAGWLDRFAGGLARDVAEFGVALVGGDTVATPGPLTLTVTALGLVEAGRGLLRSGARPGDGVWVTGTVGDGALGLLAARGRLDHLADGDRTFLAGRYRLPLPRVAAGRRLLGIASAAMDVSDGLVQDLGHLCRASGVSAVLDASLLPLSGAGARAVAADQSLLALALGGGDDYEILFTAPPGAAIAECSDRAGIAMTRIGTVAAGVNQPPVVVKDGAGRPMTIGRGGWNHFGATEGGG